MSPIRSIHRQTTLLAVAVLAAAPPAETTHAAPAPYGFGPAHEIRTDAQLSAQVNAVGDFTGDGLDDLVSFWRSSFTNSLVGDVYVTPMTATGLGQRQKWHDFFSINDELPLTGDFNGDGRDDVISFLRGTSGDVYVALSDGSTFGPGQLWHGDFCIGAEIPVVADINGDGMDDILTFTRSSTPRVFAALSTGSGFLGTGALWHPNFCPPGALPFAGDVNGDGRDDIIAFYRSSQSGQAQGDVMVALSSGSNFGAANKWHEWFSIGDEIPLVGDFDADGRADIATCTRGSSADVHVALSTGSGFASTGGLWHTDFAGGSTKLPMAGRFNADLNTDLMSFRDTTGFGPIELALAGGHAVPRQPDIGEFGYGTMGVPWALPPLNSRPDLVQIPLVVVLVEIPGQPTFASAGRDRDSMDQMIFGSAHPNVRDYFREMSAGKFTFSRVTVVGPIQMDPADAPGGVYGDVIKQELADRGINFHVFDTDGNGTIENKELAILMIDNATPAGGQTRGTQETVNDSSGTIKVHCAVAAAGYLGVVDLYAHELCHTIGTYDMYSSYCYNQSATLMHCNATTSPTSLVHLDPFHKMRFGWATPDIYDVRYPGITFIDVAQTTGLAGKNPPVLLLDPARDPREFYMLDYRSRDWDGATPTRPGRPRAGYDIDVVRSASRGPGFGMWYYNINASNQFITRHCGVRPGGNLNLDSSLAPGSDDFTGTEVLFVNNVPTRLPVIFPGPDGILQSSLSGDDVHATDAMAYLSTTPANYPSRRTSQLLDSGSGTVDPEWFDRTPVAGGLSLRFLEGTAAAETGYVQWGKNFTPFLTLTSSPTVTAGDAFAVAGNLGLRDPDTFIPAITNGEHTYDLPVTQWTVLAAALRVPLNARPGDYRLLMYADETRQLVSNSLPFTIENPYYLWAATTLPELLESNSDLALPFGDADGDGWVNIAEFLLDSDPLDSAPPLLTYTPRSGQPTQVRWTEYSGRSDLVSARAQVSTDLITWTNQTSSVVAQSGPRITRAIVLPGTSQRYFVRLVFEAAD